MPYVALAVAFLVLSGPFGPAVADGSSKAAFVDPTSSLLPAFDNGIYGDRDDDDDEDAAPDDDDYGYGDDDDDENDSAHGPDDDDDGWDVDEYERSERA